MTFFACHSSGVISRTLPVLYAVMSCFAFSRPAEDVRSILQIGYVCQPKPRIVKVHTQLFGLETEQSGTHYAVHYIGKEKLTPRGKVSHLGSETSAQCRTRPQYVLRSYWDAGKSRVPGNEDVMAKGYRRDR